MAWTGDDASFQGFVDKHSLKFPQISDDPGKVFARFGVSAQPALVVVDPHGGTKVFFGAVDHADLEAALTKAAAA